MMSFLLWFTVLRHRKLRVKSICKAKKFCTDFLAFQGSYFTNNSSVKEASSLEAWRSECITKHYAKLDRTVGKKDVERKVQLFFINEQEKLEAN